MSRECKHIWRFREKRRTMNGFGYYYDLVTYYCEKCLKVKRVGEL